METDVFDPPLVVSHVGPIAPLLFFGSVALAAVAYAVYLTVRDKDLLPVALCVGALICAINEPIFDVLGKISYADDQYIAYTAFGRSIPWFLVIGYLPWVGLLPLLIARAIARGVSSRALHLVALLGVLSVAGVEAVNLWMGGWEYYGESPLKFFGGVAAMACVPLAGGVAIHLLIEPLSGWRRLFAGLVAPTMILPMMFAATGWPLYVALYSDLPSVLDYAAVALMFVLIGSAVSAMTSLVEKFRTVQCRELVTE
jgi:hypothetical protein